MKTDICDICKIEGKFVESTNRKRLTGICKIDLCEKHRHSVNGTMELMRVFNKAHELDVTDEEIASMLKHRGFERS